MCKFIFVTGGVISGLGKGIASASIGALLTEFNFKINIKKLDPYLNVDPGTINPKEHGEVFVTSDGLETDLDLGYYERFTNIKPNKHNSTSSGKLYQELLQEERNGKYLGKTIQVIPHFTNKIKEFILHDSNNYDFIICELGGTIGDIESIPFAESIRQLKIDYNIMLINLTYLVHYKASNELKTKPTQQSLRNLMQFNLNPDLLICRTDHPITDDIYNKLSLHSNLTKNKIIESQNLKNIYQAPFDYHSKNVHNIIFTHFNLSLQTNNYTKWENIYNSFNKVASPAINIAIIGKYTELEDSYCSIIEALYHTKINFNITWIKAKDTVDLSLLDNISGIIIPGGFGYDGSENIIQYIQFARTNKIPLLGICFGMQLMCIEFARNVLNIKNATSQEFENDVKPTIQQIYHHLKYSPTPIQEPNYIITLDEFKPKELGATMRLGDSSINISNNSMAYSLYKQDIISERHRHRFELSLKYFERFNDNGLIISGMCEQYPEIIEIPNQFFIGCQFHPEFNSNIFNPNPLFLAFGNWVKKMAK